MENTELPSKAADEQTDIYLNEEDGTSGRTKRQLITFVTCKELELNDGALQARGSGSTPSGKRKADPAERQLCLSEALGKAVSLCESQEHKKVATFDRTLINILLPRSISKVIDKCNEEQRTRIASDDLIEAATALGCEDFLEPVKLYIQQHIKLEEGDSHTDVPRPGCEFEDWHNNVQELLKMMPRQCSTCCPCRLVRFTKDNYK